MGDSYEWTSSAIRRRIQKGLEIQERSSQGLTKKTYTIEAAPNVIKTLERFLQRLQYCAGVGHSATVGMYIDGDGADRFKVVSPDLPKLAEGDVEENAKGSYERVRASD